MEPWGTPREPGPTRDFPPNFPLDPLSYILLPHIMDHDFDEWYFCVRCGVSIGGYVTFFVIVNHFLAHF